MSEKIKIELMSLLPFTGGVVIIISILNGVIYYTFFGVNIISYLDFSECLLLFLDDIVVFAVLLFALLIGIIGIYKIKQKAELDYYKFNTELIKLFRSKQSIIFLFLISPLVGFIKYSNFKNYLMTVGFGYSILLSCFLCYYFIRIFVNRLIKEELKLKYFIYSLFTCVYLVIMFEKSLINVIRIKFNKEERKYVSLKLNSGETIDTSDTLVFFGQTKNYIFFYNPNSSMKSIFKKENVYLIKFK